MWLWITWERSLRGNFTFQLSGFTSGRGFSGLVVDCQVGERHQCRHHLVLSVVLWVLTHRVGEEPGRGKAQDHGCYVNSSKVKSSKNHNTSIGQKIKSWNCNCFWKERKNARKYRELNFKLESVREDLIPCISWHFFFLFKSNCKVGLASDPGWAFGIRLMTLAVSAGRTASRKCRSSSMSCLLHQEVVL